MFFKIRDELAGIHRLKRSAYSITAVDSILSFIEISYKYGYIKPNSAWG